MSAIDRYFKSFEKRPNHEEELQKADRTKVDRTKVDRKIQEANLNQFPMLGFTSMSLRAYECFESHKKSQP